MERSRKKGIIEQPFNRHKTKTQPASACGLGLRFLCRIRIRKSMILPIFKPIDQCLGRESKRAPRSPPVDAINRNDTSLLHMLGHKTLASKSLRKLSLF
jgi:hypothetical protein